MKMTSCLLPRNPPFARLRRAGPRRFRALQEIGSIWYSGSYNPHRQFQHQPFEVDFLLKKLIPHKSVSSIYEINLQALKDAGIRGIITDLDNTLAGAKDPLATPKLVEWLKRVKEQSFQIIIVSNNNRSRVAKFAEPLGIPFIHSARKPFNRAFRAAMRTMKLEPRQTVVVGDQMLTDVFGGNRLGLYTIMVLPVAPMDEGVATRINRRLERIAVAILKRRGLMPWQD